MYLSKLTLDPRHPQARRDLGDAYEMHRTLYRAFAFDDETQPGRFLWRLERRSDYQPSSVVLVQAAQAANWAKLEEIDGYALLIQGNKQVDLNKLIQAQARYRFRLLTNPTVTRGGKRYGLLREEEQLAWLERQGDRCGFTVQASILSISERLQARQGAKGNRITVDTALFDGLLMANNPEQLRQVILCGIGHAKALGLGMLSVARVA